MNSSIHNDLTKSALFTLGQTSLKSPVTVQNKSATKQDRGRVPLAVPSISGARPSKQQGKPVALSSRNGMTTMACGSLGAQQPSRMQTTAVTSRAFPATMAISIGARKTSGL